MGTHGAVRRQLWGIGSFLLLWVARIELRASGLHNKCFYLLGHLAGLVVLNLVTQFFSRSFVDGKIVYQKADLPAPQAHSLYL